MRKLFCPLLFLFTISAWSQNLVMNGDFEDRKSVKGPGDKTLRAEGWKSMECYTVDVFGSSYGEREGVGPGVKQREQAPYANIRTRSGCALGEIVTYTKNYADYRDYVAFSLKEPLQPDSEYQVTFFLEFGGFQSKSQFLSNNAGVVFSKSPLKQNGYSPIARGPKVEITSIIIDEWWQAFTFRFTADSAYRWMTIGNFRTDSLTLTKALDKGPEIARYFIDDVSLVPYRSGKKTSKPVLLPDSITSWKIFPNPGNGDQKLVLREMNGAVTITVYDAAGNMLYRTNSQAGEGENTVPLYLDFLSPGIYFIELNNSGKNSVQKLIIR